MKSEKSSKHMTTTILLVLLYIIVVSLLCYLGVLSGENLVLTFTAALGWLVALLIAIIHLDRARRDNQAAKKYEIKKRLEIEAFKEINKAINEFSSKITSFLVFFSSLPNTLELHLQDPLIFKFDLIQIDQEMRSKNVDLLKGSADFLLTIEANEIAVIEYDHFRKYIGFRKEDLRVLISDFDLYFTKIKMDRLEQEEGFLEFKEKCEQISELGHELISYLFDYRIILMNSLLKDIFMKSVPPRKPRDPQYKTLEEVAIKEEVEKEAERRIKAAMK